VVRALDAITAKELAEIEAELAAAAAEDLKLAEGEFVADVVYELRYSGQAFELPVAAAPGKLEDAFHDAHQERFGFAEREAAVELVTVRVAVAPIAPDAIDLAGADPAEPATSPLTGPAVIEQPHVTIVVPLGWTATRVDGDVVLDRDPEGGAR
jgi:N-methylhydantoinase A/oxoprolinase/acetone carboxylase beta subunit